MEIKTREKSVKTDTEPIGLEEEPKERIQSLLKRLDEMEREAGYFTQPPNWEIRRRLRRRIALCVCGVVLVGTAIMILF
jgi:hypothetical protein